jgi:hypothetical protein
MREHAARCSVESTIGVQMNKWTFREKTRMTNLLVALALLIIVLVAALFFARHTFFRPYLAPVEPRIIPPSPVHFSTTNSHFFLPFSISIPALEEELNENVPEKLDGVIDHPLKMDVIAEDELEWSVARESISLQGEGHALFLHTDVSGHARFRGKIDVPLLRRVPVSTHVDISATVDGKSIPVLNPDWTISPGVSAHVEVHEAKIPLKGLGSINVEGSVSERLNKEKDKWISKLNETVAEDRSLLRLAETEWRKLFLAVKIHDQPGVWLRITPRSVTARERLSTEGDQLHFGVGISAETHLFLGEQAPQNPASSLPMIEISDDIPTRFELAVPAFIPWKEINAALVALVKGKSFEVGDGSSIRIDEVNITPSAEDLLVRVGFTAAKGNWVRSARGTIFLRGRPVLDPAGNTFKVSELSYDLATQNLLLQVSDWLLKPGFLENLEKYLIVDLGQYSRTGIEQGNREIQKLIAKLPEGIDLDLRLTDMQFRSFVYDAEYLYLSFLATGESRATVRSLNFGEIR